MVEEYSRDGFIDFECHASASLKLFLQKGLGLKGIL